MNQRIMLALALTLVSVLGVSAAQEDAGLEWRTDLSAARLEAETAGKPMLVVFR